MKNLTVGIFAHVDSGKTTLSEALLYLSGTTRKLGKVDKKDSFLDTFSLEKERGRVGGGYSPNESDRPYCQKERE